MLLSDRVQVWDIQFVSVRYNEFNGTGVALCLRSVLLDWSIMQPHLSTHPSCIMIQLTNFNRNHCHSTLKKGSAPSTRKRLQALAVVWELPSEFKCPETSWANRTFWWIRSLNSRSFFVIKSCFNKYTPQNSWKTVIRILLSVWPFEEIR